VDTILKIAGRTQNAYEMRYARVLMAMSLAEAKELLGFGASESPSEKDVIKAYRAKSLANHPDRGGTHERMLEVNVARDILLGKVDPNKTSPIKEDPEEAERRKAEIRKQLNIASVKTQMEKSQKMLSRVLSDLGLFNQSWKLDLKEYLNEEYADIIDRIHDAAVEAEKTPNTTKVAKLAQDLASSAMRAASKFGSLRKALNQLVDDPTVEKVAAVYKDAKKFATNFHSLRADSGKLVTLFRTDSDDLVPIEWDDIYSKAHQMLIQFDNDFQKIPDTGLKALQDQVEMSVDSVSEMLRNEYGLKGFPDWKTWRIPGDFLDAVEAIERVKG